jgi:DNA-binding protein H-NS
MTAMEIMVARQDLAEIKRKIAELQQQVEAVRAEEVAGVVARIREAITYYDLTIKDVFGGRTTGVGRSKAKKALRSVSAKKAAVVRYCDSAGNSWAGRGKRPNWLKAALANGTALDDLAV